MKKIPTGTVDFAIIAVILAALWCAAATSYSSEALTPVGPGSWIERQSPQIIPRNRSAIRFGSKRT